MSCKSKRSPSRWEGDQTALAASAIRSGHEAPCVGQPFRIVGRHLGVHFGARLANAVPIQANRSAFERGLIPIGIPATFAF